MIQIDGKRIVAWLRKSASPSEATMLVGTEFADDCDEYELRSPSPGGFICAHRADKKERFVAYPTLSQGTFFVNDAIGVVVQEKFRNNQTPAEKSIDEAIGHVSELGFTASTLGGDLVTLKLSQLLKKAMQTPDSANEADCINLHEILDKTDHHNIRVGLKHLVVWLKQIEDSFDNSQFYDLGLRSRISSLFRKIGDVRAALGLSEFLDGNDRWVGGKTGEQYLRVSRAAALMDGIERRLFTNPHEIFPVIRRNLRIAHAISQGQSEHALECFNRLNALEKKTGPV